MTNATTCDSVIDDRDFLKSLWLWDLHDTQTRWLLNDVSCALRECRTERVGGNITIHLDDNGVPGRFAELRVGKVESSRARVLRKAKKLRGQ